MKKQIAIIENHRRAALKKNRNCFETNCKVRAIDSHILQKNGVISRIAEKGHVVECVIDPFQSDSILRFKKTGINNVFTFKGFCKDHDDDLFKDIEKQSFDLSNYYHQLIFAYRTSVNETRKKEVVIDYYKSLMHEPEVVMPRDHLERLIDSQKLGISDGDYTREMLLKNIFDSTLRDFTFYSRELPKIDVCVCGVFTFETSYEIKELELTQNPKFNDALTDVFITFIPLVEKSMLSIGFITNHNTTCDDYYRNLFKKEEEHAIRQHISDLMLLQVENWITSSTYFEEKISSQEAEIRKIIQWAQSNWDERITLKLNLLD